MMTGLRGHAAVLCMLVAAPLLGLLAAGAAFDHLSALSAASRRTVELAQLGAERESMIVDAAANTLRLLGEIPSVRDAVPVACETQVRATVDYDPQLDGVGVIFPNGTVACSSHDERSGLSVLDRGYFRQALHSAVNAPPAVEIVVGRSTGSPAIVVALPIPPANPGQDPRGVLAAALSLQWFAQLATQIPDGIGRLALVIDPMSGKVLARDAQAVPAYDDPLADPTLLAALRRSPSGGVITSADGNFVPMIFGFAPIVVGSRHFMLTVGVSRKDVLGAVNRRLRMSAAVAVLATLAASLVSWFAATVFVLHPIAMLAAAARRFGAGDLTARAPTSVRLPELRRLGLAFNGMASRLEAANRQLEALAAQDALTGLANRRRFEELLQSEHRRSKRSLSPLSLVAIDVDHFKAFNDTYGHPAGDDCLKALARAIEGALRRPGDLAARIGGEEFSVLLPATDETGAAFIAESIREAALELAVPHVASPAGIVTVSIGVATAPPAGDWSPSALIRAADETLYAAKRDGRNKIQIAPAFARNDSP